MPFKRFSRGESQESRYDEDYYGKTDNSASNDGGYDYGAEEPAKETREEPRRPAAKSAFQNSGVAYSMKLMKPAAYTDGSAIADELLANNAAIINLEKADAETASNLIYFLDGVIYAIGGHLKQVSANTFMLTPSNMEITEPDAEPEDETEPEPPQTGSGFGYQGYGSGYRG